MELLPRLSVAHGQERTDTQITIYAAIMDGQIVVERFETVLKVDDLVLPSMSQSLILKAIEVLDAYYPFWRDKRAYWGFEEISEKT